MTFAISRRATLAAAILATCVVVFAVLLAAISVGSLRGVAERELSARLGTAVHIGALSREGIFSFSPVVRAKDVDVDQAAWAGPGKMASIRSVRLKTHILPLLIGSLHVQLLSLDGARLDLRRTADGQVNWRKGAGERKRGGGGLDLSEVSVSDTMVRYIDAKQNRSALLNVRIDPTSGLIIDGKGSIDGAAVKIDVRGGPLRLHETWPFHTQIAGTSINFRVDGTAAGPLRLADMRFHVSAKADDLKRIDRIIEAGLFGTQAVDLEADVERKADVWSISKLAGRVGQSRLHGKITATKTSGPTKIDGQVHFSVLNFDDLASNAGRAKAAALEQSQGLKLVPNTRINIHKVKAEGRILVEADRVVGGERPSSITTARAELTIKNHVLTIDPLRLGFSQGAIVGRAVVDQRDNRTQPRMTLTLDLQNSSLAALAGSKSGAAEAGVDARVRLVGVGDTIREAVGASSGRIGIAASAGQLPSKTAAMMGFDIGRVLTASPDGMVALRCGAINLKVHHGQGVVDPLLIDTSVSQMRGTGTVRFPTEAIAIKLSGAPKGGSALRMPGTVSATGTLRSPKIEIPEATKSVGGLISILKRAVSGQAGTVATDANCPALIATATRF